MDKGQSRENVQEEALTDHFVLLPVADGGAKQTLHLVCVVRIVPLSQEERKMKVRSKRRSKSQRRSRSTDRPGEALVLGHVCNVERLHAALHILSIHVVDLAQVLVPANTHLSGPPGPPVLLFGI